MRSTHDENARLDIRKLEELFQCGRAIEIQIGGCEEASGYAFVSQLVENLYKRLKTAVGDEGDGEVETRA